MIAYTLDGPLKLAPNKTSSILTLSPSGQDVMFLRAIALWTDNTAFRGATPTFQVRAPGGIFTDVEADGQEVAVTGEEDMFGRATCLPQGDDDIFLLTVTIDSLFLGANWHVRIINNASQELRFVTVGAVNGPATEQPWIIIGEPPTDIAPAGAATFTFDETDDEKYVRVSNWGTGHVQLLDEIGKPIGGDDSPLVLVKRPDTVRPHGVDHMIIRCDAVGVAADLPFRFKSNDKRDDHGLINVRVK